ncbi:MAG: Mu transposase C-terminal domain-containing protein [Burkholderiaceae bacterium]|nr:Mu transposase C-terminal domain-containing protein [Burkholderiaceae bacterium]
MTPSNSLSLETLRRFTKRIDKRAIREAIVGALTASVDFRTLRRLHTSRPGERGEYDYTHPSLCLFPNEEWSEPLTHHLGLGVDHMSGVVKGYSSTTAPCGADLIRLYRRCVLPKLLWLPDNLLYLADDWDVFGLDDLVAIDNGPEFVAEQSTHCFIYYGTVVLRMPPKRGEFKGTVERTHRTFEDQFIRTLRGWIPNLPVTSHEYKRALEKAKREATLTVREFEEKLAKYTRDFNHAPHPRFKSKSRISVWREAQEDFPVLLPTGDVELRSVFALTYISKLGRHGVIANGITFNSDELNYAWRHYQGDVTIKLDPDDIRRVLVFVPEYLNPIEAEVTTFEAPDFPVSLELYKSEERRQDAGSSWQQPTDGRIGFDPAAAVMRTKGPRSPTSHTTLRTDARVAEQSSRIAETHEVSHRKNTTALDRLLSDGKLSVEELQ